MTKSPIHADDAPRAIGPYSQAIELLHAPNRVVYLSGQTSLDPATGDLVAGDIAAQTERVISNLEAVLRGAGLGLPSVVKTTVFLVDMNDFGKMNEVYARRFAQPYPARSTIGVASLPKGAKVEIEVVAVG